MSTLRKILLSLVFTSSSVRNLWLDKPRVLLLPFFWFRLRLIFLGPMLFSSRPCAGFLPGWLSLVRPRKGNHSAGLIIWFERSGGSGTEQPLTCFWSTIPWTKTLTFIRDQSVS